MRSQLSRLCKAEPFTIDKVRIGHFGELAVQSDSDQMEWTATHHNWNDSAVIEIGAQVYSLKVVGSGLEFNYDLTMKNKSDGSTEWRPIVLEPVNAGQ